MQFYRNCASRINVFSFFFSLVNVEKTEKMEHNSRGGMNNSVGKGSRASKHNSRGPTFTHMKRLSSKVQTAQKPKNLDAG